MVSRRWMSSLALALWGASFGCQRGTNDTNVSASALGSASATPGEVPSAPATFGKNSVAAAMPEGKPMLGITSFVAIVFDEPKDTAKRIGYLRVGALVPRSEQPVGTKGCAEGWYEIAPRGFVCAGKDATTNLEDPLLKAAARRPDTTAALPYRYGFVRAVLPMYIKVPSAEEQNKSEFKLKDHLEWYDKSKDDVDRMKLGAFDVPLDERGVPIKGKNVGDLGQRKTSVELKLGELLGGNSDDDAIPFWLEGGKRGIPNISDFKVGETSVFADRARRFTGLAFVGSFPTGPESLNRRFAITTDLRLAPTTKIKPDSGSPWHGIEIEDANDLPFAFVREQDAVRYVASGDSAARGDELAHRSVVKLTGKLKRLGGEKFYVTRDGDLVRAGDVGLVVAPRTFPKAGENGEKWIDVNITEQTLIMWEGKRPIYATLVSTGREEFPTVTGEFKIRNKHITATMDSNEGSDVGGGAPVRARGSSGDGDEVVSAGAPDSGSAKAGSGSAAAAKKPDAKKTAKKDDKKPTTNAAAPKKTGTTQAEKGSKKPASGDKAKTPKDKEKPKDKASKEKPKDKAKPGAPASKDGAPAKIPKRGDGEYGVTKRRGEGTYQLRDVPYIQYFAQGYALHAAYWHDVFGKQRSHGCINLSPIDAHRVFMWTEPAIPDGWHAINTGPEFGEGTTVVVHE